MQYLSPAPFTAKAFWERMLVLIEDTNQPPSKEKVEETLGMKFGRASESGLVHFADPEADWYFGVTLNLHKPHPKISVGTQGKGPMQFSDGSLLWGPTVYQSLMANGWKKSRPLPHFYPGMHRYEKESLHGAITETKLEISGMSFDWLL